MSDERQISGLPKGSLNVVTALREAKSILATEAADEITRLRAELAAETKARKAYADKWPALVQERDALRALLREAREVAGMERISFPTIVVGDTVIVGFKEYELRKALGL